MPLVPAAAVKNTRNAVEGEKRGQGAKGRGFKGYPGSPKAAVKSRLIGIRRGSYQGLDL